MDSPLPPQQVNGIGASMTVPPIHSTQPELTSCEMGILKSAPTIQAPGALDVPLFQFQVREVTTLNGVTINSLRLNASRNGDDAAHITAVKLYDDTNGNGLVDDGEALLGCERV